MHQHNRFLFLGRQADISLAEYTAVSGNIPTVLDGPNTDIAICKQDPVNFNNLGGIIKTATNHRLTELNTPNLKKIVADLIEAQALTAKRIVFGVSYYGPRSERLSPNKIALDVKKALKQNGRSVRVLPNKTGHLSGAQLLHNSIGAKDNRFEVCLIADKQQLYIALTDWVQDIDAYSQRDRNRPNRDSRVGMLPPKLAQIIINLAQATPDTGVLDPFCGSGVLIQEASLMGIEVVGSDISSRMVDFSQKNTDWLRQTHTDLPRSTIVQADARHHLWGRPIKRVAAETYLGPALHHLPSSSQLNQIVNEVNQLHLDMLANIWPQLSPNARLCLAVPAWKTSRGFRQLPLLDHLDKVGYNRIDILGNNKNLFYHRDGQLVARELLVLGRKN